MRSPQVTRRCCFSVGCRMCERGIAGIRFARSPLPSRTRRPRSDLATAVCSWDALALLAVRSTSCRISGSRSMVGTPCPVGSCPSVSGCPSSAFRPSRRLAVIALRWRSCCVRRLMRLPLTQCCWRPSSGESLLPVLAAYGPTPSPPLVLVGGDDALAERITAVLERLHQDPDGRAALALGRIARVERMNDADYDQTRSCDREAATCTR